MKIKPILSAIVLGALLYLLVVTPLFQEQSFPWMMSQWITGRSSSFARTITPLPNLDKHDTFTATTDLIITKSSSPAMATASEPLTYTIVVSNTGPATAYNLLIVDVLPTGTHFQGESTLALVKGADPQLHVSLRMLTGTVGSLLPTGRVEIMGRTLVETNASSTTLHNTASITATNANSSSNNHVIIDTPLLTATPTPIASQTPTQTASPITTAPTPMATPTLIATTIPNQADLEIKKSAAYKAVIAGAILTYTMQINNFGPGPAHNVVIQDQLPKGLVFEGLARVSVLRGEESKLLLTQEHLTATISVLNVTGIITISAPVRTAPTTPTAILVNQASVTSTTPDQQPGNNRATAPLTVIAAPPMTESYYLPLIRQ